MAFSQLFHHHHHHHRHHASCLASLSSPHSAMVMPGGVVCVGKRIFATENAHAVVAACRFCYLRLPTMGGLSAE